MDYTLKISPRMLELLSSHLYSNIYFVLGELIANAYDADAENVYVYIDKNSIRVEDDGNGMFPSEVNDTYLVVGTESRNSSQNARTKKKQRLKMGRKGIGKLAALSISDGFQLITIKDGIKTALFVPGRIEKDNEVLRELNVEEYNLNIVKDHGTAVIMNSPRVKIPVMAETIVNNLNKIFPKISDDFNIFVVYKGKQYSVTQNEQDVISRLATLMTIGTSHNGLKEHLNSEDENVSYQAIEEMSKQIEMFNSSGIKTTMTLKIHGWIGTYVSTRGMKKDITEFSDNYLAIFSHNKLGQRNVLDLVGKNRVFESYIVGNLYIDAFEDPDFPDMASTNRQGYNEQDPRWQAALKMIRELVDKVVAMRTLYKEKAAELENKRRQQNNLEKEQELNQKIEDASNKLREAFSSVFSNPEEANSKTEEAINQFRQSIGLKTIVDSNKKKIIISQTLMDKLVSDLVYKMLLFNNVPAADIIYSNADNRESNIPEGNVYDYLRDFFVNSISDEKIYVLFVTSENIFCVNDDESIKHSWGVMMEIGATWITKKDHAIFNINGFNPREPMNTKNKIVDVRIIGEEGNKRVSISGAMCNTFIDKITIACSECGYTPKSFEANMAELMNYVQLFDPAS